MIRVKPTIEVVNSGQGPITLERSDTAFVVRNSGPLNTTVHKDSLVVKPGGRVEVFYVPPPKSDGLPQRVPLPVLTIVKDASAETSFVGVQVNAVSPHSAPLTTSRKRQGRHRSTLGPSTDEPSCPRELIQREMERLAGFEKDLIKNEAYTKLVDGIKEHLSDPINKKKPADASVIKQTWISNQNARDLVELSKKSKSANSMYVTNFIAKHPTILRVIFEDICAGDVQEHMRWLKQNKPHALRVGLLRNSVLSRLCKEAISPV